MKQTVIICALLCGLATFVSCGRSNPNTRVTILPHRALISNLTSSRIDIADTTRDLLVTAISGDLPGRLLVSNDKKYTLTLSPIDNSVSLIINSQQATIGSANLAGTSDGVVFTVDDGLILGAVPTEAGPVGQPPGAVDVITVVATTVGANTSTTVTRQPSIFLPGARYVAATPNTNTILVLSDSVANPASGGGPTGRVWILKTSLVNGNTQPYEEVVSSFWDHPVFAMASADNLSAYILNCGKECGGTQAGIVKVDLSVDPPVATAQLPLPDGATVAYLKGTTLYVAGSDPSVSCGATGFPAPCGGLTPVDLNAFSAGTPVTIAGGYHSRMTLGSNNLLFAGSRGCTIVRASDPLQGFGCLSLFDIAKSTATVAAPTPFTPPAPDPGDDVTGMTPIANRNEVYVIQGGELVIYDTTTQKAKIQSEPPNIIGQAVDVVAVDN